MLKTVARIWFPEIIAISSLLLGLLMRKYNDKANLIAVLVANCAAIVLKLTPLVRILLAVCLVVGIFSCSSIGECLHEDEVNEDAADVNAGLLNLFTLISMLILICLAELGLNYFEKL
ncbi:hypothetical protein U1Q18_001805 [Sarracenia purpurea var. burkii]